MIGREDIPEWVMFGTCGQVDPELFHTAKGNSAAPAKRICLACPVRVDCLNYALERNEEGIWGGKSESERRTLKQARRRDVAA